MRSMPKLDKWKKEFAGFLTAVEGRRLYSTSPSQLASYKDCPKKWYQEAVLQRRQPETTSTALGTETHRVIENVIDKGEAPSDAWPNAVAIASVGQKYWPVPGEDDFEQEQEFLLHTDDDVPPLHGFYDILWKTKGKVTDHKTTSDFKWAKSEHELRFDPQPVVYSAHALSIGVADRSKDKPRVHVQFLYYRTKGARAILEVTTALTEQDVEQGLVKIHATQREMLQNARLPLDQVPHNTDMCGKYGGCHLRQFCAAIGVPVSGHTVFDDIAEDLSYPQPQDQQVQQQVQGVPMSDTPAVASNTPAAVSSILARRNQMAQRIAKEEVDAENGVAAPATPAAAGPLVNPPDGFPMNEPGTKDGPPPPAPAPSPVAAPEPAPPKTRLGGTGGRPKKTEEPKAVVHDVQPEVKAEEAQVPLAQELANREKALVEAQQRLEDTRKTLRDANNKYAELSESDEDAAAEFQVDTLVPARKAVKAAELALAAAQSNLDVTKAAVAAEEAAAKAAADKAKKEAEEKAKQAAPAPAAPPVVLAEKLAVTAKWVIEGAEARTPRLYVGCMPRGEECLFFDEWVQPYFRRAEATRKTAYWLNMQHEAVPAVIAEILADLRSGKVVLDKSMVFPRYTAQQSGFVDALVPFFGAHNVVERIG